MVFFAVTGHQAKNDASFSLNDLPSSGGRMDLLCRCVQASLFLSHGIREDASCFLILAGGPGATKTVRFEGASVRSLSPDERSSASFIKKALEIPAGSLFREVTPGVSVRKAGLETLLGEHRFGVLDEAGTDIRNAGVKDLPEGFLLSDHQNFTPEEELLIRDLPRYSLGPQILHADHAIVLLYNEIDRRRSGWN
ncbi:tRNA (pseudouridine(54)-N(1))-methyltransferase TrmY [uncultured Methanospirillum sp.]|uniref:tRNA (pseudouridine(54)-N(1))-methyltransferase TrmY n=1 Tax=uncultured Methanospirillum sp. TaxID=262503 RepID=UPI0029C80DDD|nr:tRNA (pseudouridine(54)-N(1))-methyltransferase TrmY [uncultured Methanospirillum sp.]